MSEPADDDAGGNKEWPPRRWRFATLALLAIASVVLSMATPFLRGLGFLLAGVVLIFSLNGGNLPPEFKWLRRLAFFSLGLSIVSGGISWIVPDDSSSPDGEEDEMSRGSSSSRFFDDAFERATTAPQRDGPDKVN